MPQNWLVLAALLFWPLLALWLYWRRPASEALLWTILGGQLVLPEGAVIKLAPGIPNLDKITIPIFAALVGCLMVARHPVRFWNQVGLPEVLFLSGVIGPIITSELNGDVMFVGGGTVLPSLGHYEALSAAVAQFIFMLPFLLGRSYLRSVADNMQILRVLVIAGLFYSILILFEIRMGPQLHVWLYGYPSSDMDIDVRGDGFRPRVFLVNGLALALFAATSLVAAAAFWRARVRVYRWFPSWALTAYLGTILILCQSAAALVYGAVCAPLLRWAKPRIQLQIAVVFVSIALTYPVLRFVDVVPTGSMIEVATWFSTDRANSLKFRFENEQILLEHASKRFAFGWGRFGRSRAYDKDGNDISITDGGWIVTLGDFGLVGFLAQFGLLALPVFRAASALRFTQSPRESVILAALALVLAINIIDLLPNSFLTPFIWLVAGALLGRTEALRIPARQIEDVGMRANAPGVAS
jgi:hypothetical protein